MGLFDDMLNEGQAKKFEEIVFVAKEPVKARITGISSLEKNGKRYIKVNTTILDGEYAGKNYSVFTGTTINSSKTGKIELGFTFRKLIKALLPKEVEAAVTPIEAAFPDNREKIINVAAEAFVQNGSKLVGHDVEMVFAPAREYMGKTYQDLSNIIDLGLPKIEKSKKVMEF